MTDPWSADFDDLRVFSLAMQNKLELSVCLSVLEKISKMLTLPHLEKFLRTLIDALNSLGHKVWCCLVQFL